MAAVKKEPTSDVMLCHGTLQCGCGCARCLKGYHAPCMLKRTAKEAGF